MKEQKSKRAKEIKLSFGTLYKEAQQKRFEERRNNPAYKQLDDPSQVQVHEYAVDGLKDAKQEYSNTLSQLEAEGYNAEHVVEVEQLQAIYADRLGTMEEQQSSTKTRLTEIAEELDTLKQNQTDEVGNALATGDLASAEAIKSRARKQRDTLKDEQEELEHELPAITQAIATLKIDLEVWQDMLEHLKKGIVYNEYQTTRQQFEILFKEIKPVYGKCLSLIYQLGAEDAENCHVRLQLHEMMVEHEKEQNPGWYQKPLEHSLKTAFYPPSN